MKAANKMQLYRLIQIKHQPDAIISHFIILTTLAASGFTFVSWWQPCCVRSRAGPTTNTARLSPRYEGKTSGCHCSHWAPDDGRESARNML